MPNENLHERNPCSSVACGAAVTLRVRPLPPLFERLVPQSLFPAVIVVVQILFEGGNATPFAGRTRKVEDDWLLSGSSVQGPGVSAMKSSASAICDATIIMTRWKVGKVKGVGMVCEATREERLEAWLTGK
jgi:hypothetical protein